MSKQPCSMGSTVSYGRRYTTLDLLNIVTRGVDDGGKKAGRPQPPDGYDDWWSTLTATADNGIAVLEKTWKDTQKFTSWCGTRSLTMRRKRESYDCEK